MNELNSCIRSQLVFVIHTCQLVLDISDLKNIYEKEERIVISLFTSELQRESFKKYLLSEDGTDAFIVLSA